MALVTYLIGACSGGPAILVDFNSSSLPAVNGNYYLTFNGATDDGCYDIIDNAEPSTGVDTVTTISTDYGDCGACLSANPTPTPTPTLTQTPTNTATNTPTPSVTATNTPTVTRTPTNTPTVTTTNTPTVTTTNTSTPTNTPTVTTTVTTTNTSTPTNTPTPSVTTTKTSTPTVTPTNTSTPRNTPSVTATNTPTVTKTPTNTPTPTSTPTPSPSPYPLSGYSVDNQYAYTVEILGNFSGGSITIGGPANGVAPHPIFTDANGVPFAQLNAITLGGVNGLNN
jgi:hypothetical protein